MMVMEKIVNKQDIEDIYPLSHLQQGMLFHSLYSAHAGMYVEQSHCTIQGKLNTVAFQAAWQKVVERHTVLRTHFSWLRRDKPLQIVRKQATLPWQIHDWRGLPKQEQQQKFAALLVQDRERDFDLSKAPLLRLTLVQISATEYYFVWSHYHAILDGWSVSILFKEVIALYAALCRDQLGLLPASRSYGDYIAWQQKQHKAQAEQFWRKTLEGFSVPTTLPTLGKQVLQAASEEAAYAAEQHTIPQTTMLAVEELVKRQRITLGTLCQGIWALLLSRYGNQDDVLFGMTVSGRSIEMANIESMVGLFINTLPVRVKVPASLSLLDWLKQLQEQQLEMLQYTYVSLIDIQGWSNIPRNQSLFSSNIVIENYPLDPSLFAWGDDVELRDIHSIGRTNYPLAIEFTPGQTMKIQITYNTSIFTSTQISRLLDHLQVILEQIPVQLHQPLSALQIITQAELQQLLFDWNATDAAIPQDLCIHQLFEQQAQQTPGALAVADEKVRMTYAELNQQANQLARHLRSLGIGSESFVGICLDRSPAMVVGLLAILKAGGVYVPLDPHYPQDRLSFMIHDTHMSVLITTQEFLINNQPGTLQVINLNALETSLKNYSTENLAEQISPEQLAYVIYTSGSTGRPKGVQVSHRNLVYSTSARFLYYREFVSGFLLLSSFSFDSSIAGIFWTLCQGGKLVLLAAEAQRDSVRIAPNTSLL